jgi:hypothetical protein
VGNHSPGTALVPESHTRGFLGRPTTRLDPEHFLLSRAEGLAAGRDDQLGQGGDGSLQLIGEFDGRVIVFAARAPSELLEQNVTKYK